MVNFDKAPYLVSDAEHNLLMAIADTKFGEVLNVEILYERPRTLLHLTGNQRLLVDFIRDGNNKLDKIVVHEGQPVSVEVVSTNRGHTTKRMMRF